MSAFQFAKKQPRIRGVKKTMIDGIKFDSKREAKYYLALTAMKQAGEIDDFERQVRFMLLPAQYEEVEKVGTRGRTKIEKKLVERAIYYIADFVVKLKNGERQVVDCKGFRTEVYRLKRKLMLHVYGVKIKEV